MKFNSVHALVVILLAWPSSVHPIYPKRPIAHNNGISHANLEDLDEKLLLINRSPKKKPSRSHVAPALDKSTAFAIKENLKNDEKSFMWLDDPSDSQLATENPAYHPIKPLGGTIAKFNPNLDKVKILTSDVLGQGGYGIVYRGFSETNEPIALKVVDVNKMAEKDKITKEEAVSKILSESHICRGLKHQNILQCAPPLFSHNSDRATIATEFCEKGDLMGQIISKTLSKAEAQCSFWQLLNGLDYMHSKKVVHRDIKPDNLFLKKSGLLKIGDFGLARKLPLDLRDLRKRAGTDFYMAPEMFKAGFKHYPYAADVWASAITYIEIRTFHRAWKKAIQDDSTFQSFKSNPSSYLQSINFKNSNQEHFSKEEVNILLKMLQLNPYKRITVKNLLKNPWIQSLKNQCPPSMIANY